MRIVDLTCPFDKEYSVPQYLHHSWRLEFRALFTFPRDGERVTEFTMSTHTGTHVDAPSHMLRDGKTLDDFPLSTFYGPGVVLDVKKGELGQIEAADLKRADVGIQENDIVLLCTGWGKYYVDEPKDTFYLATKRPGLALSGAEWLVERRVKLVGIDAYSISGPGPGATRIGPGVMTERMPTGGEVDPVHHLLLSRDIVICEQMMNLEAIVGRRVIVGIFPLPLKTMDGAPVRAVAFVD